MKTLKLGHNGQKQVKLMNQKEFTRFLKNKTVYHHECGWIKKWKGTTPITEYFPYKGFTLPSYVVLQPYSSNFPKDCLGAWSITGKFYAEYPRYKVTIRKGKSGNMYYVTRY